MYRSLVKAPDLSDGGTRLRFGRVSLRSPSSFRITCSSRGRPTALTWSRSTPTATSRGPSVHRL